MRDAFGEIDPDEIDIIDLVEPDGSAFSMHGDTAELPIQSNRRRWIPAAAITGAVGIAAAGLFAWSPWRDDGTASFPDGETPALTLTEELVFGDPPALLTAASLGTATAEGINVADVLGDGYIFAEPGASRDFNGPSSGTWAFFYATEGDIGIGTADLGGTNGGLVHGTPAGISSSPNRENQYQINFGPVDGRVFTVVTGGMSRAESLAFAKAVGFNDGVPTLANDRVLGTMQPIGDIANYRVAASTFFQAISPSEGVSGVVSVHYGDFHFDLEGNDGAAYSIASQPVVGSTTLATLRFLTKGEDGHSVHSQPAVVVNVALERRGPSQANSAVAWVEGGRLIVVSGPDDIPATLALAETVRPATDDEWAQVVAVAQDPFVPGTTVINFGEDVTLYYGVDAESGDTFSFSAQISDGNLGICIHEQSDAGSTGECGAEPGSAELPLLWTGNRAGHAFVLAVVESGLGEDAELRITLIDGTIETFPLIDHGDALPGPAVATVLPVGHGHVELWIGAKVVATL